MKTGKRGAGARKPPKVSLHRETLRHLENRELRRAAGLKLTNTCAPCGGGTGPTCSGWPPCTC